MTAELDEYIGRLFTRGGGVLARSIGLWCRGVPDEINFWSDWFNTKGLEWPQDYRLRMQPQPLPPWIEALIPTTSLYPTLLDVGSGPILKYGTFSERRTVSITATDPLAFHYRDIFESHKLSSPLETKFSFAEDLSARFDANSFDLVTCTNALDHAIEPVWGILEMLIVTKVGGVIFLSHRRNEAEYEGYSGFHQWNFDAKQGRFIVTNPSCCFDVTCLLSPIGSVKCDLINDAINVTITKKAELPFDSLTYHRKMRAGLLEALIKTVNAPDLSSSTAEHSSGTN